VSTCRQFGNLNYKTNQVLNCYLTHFQQTDADEIWSEQRKDTRPVIGAEHPLDVRPNGATQIGEGKKGRGCRNKTGSYGARHSDATNFEQVFQSVAKNSKE
jgi:hypothetical protein